MSCDTLPPRSSTEIEKKHAGLIPIAKHERCMYKVHEQLREVSEKAYKPVLLAIGPYNDQGKVGGGFMQQHKLRYLEQMLERTESEETYIKALRQMREIAAKCYVECISQTADEFLKMMLLDGCFIIELFRKYEIYRKTKDHKDDPIFQMTWVLPTIAHDLLLFENQLPFFILAKLFEMSESNGSRNSGEVHIVNIEERDESSSYISLSMVTRLIDLAVGFFSVFLPFNCKVVPLSFELTENIKHLPYHLMECERLEIWFRFKNAEFEHLLGLVHASISISILDVEIDHVKSAIIPLLGKKKIKGNEGHKEIKPAMETPYASESQAQRNLPEKWKHQHGSEIQEAGVESKAKEFRDNQEVGVRKVVNPLLEKMFEKGIKRLIKQMNLAMETPFGNESQAQRNMPEKSKHLQGSELQEAEVEFILTMKFKDPLAMEFKNHLIEIRPWMKIPYAIDLQVAGIEFDKAKKFKDLHDRKRNEDQKSKPCERGTQMDGVELKTGEKFKRLLCLDKIENWKSIPYGKELREARVKFNQAKKFKHRLHDHKVNKDRNTHSATELEEAGIKFKAAEESKVNKVQVSIKFNNGLMEISPLTIGDHTETYLRNLIAYEQYCDQDNNFNYITNYVCFMDDLINSPKDVKLLRRSGIIRNFLGDDDATSTMVSKLGHNISISSKNSIYARTSVDLNTYCSSYWHACMANLRHNYFNSPWASLSVLAAVLLFALTIAQTIFSVIP